MNIEDRLKELVYSFPRSRVNMVSDPIWSSKYWCYSVKERSNLVAKIYHSGPMLRSHVKQMLYEMESRRHIK